MHFVVYHLLIKKNLITNNLKIEIMNRQEHLQWCKDRANEINDNGDVSGAWESFISDIQEHEELENHKAIQFGMMLLIHGKLKTHEQMESFINGIK